MKKFFLSPLLLALLFISCPEPTQNLPSANAMLSGISLSDGTLLPPFAPA